MNEMIAATTTDVMTAEAKSLLQVYRRNRVVFERGEGCRLFTAEGRGYLDLISGVGVAALGHAHPKLAAAIAAQASELLHTSNLFFHPLQAEVAARLTALSGMDRVFFCNSGAEAIEASSSSRAATGTRRAARARGSSRSSTPSTAARPGRSR